MGSKKRDINTDALNRRQIFILFYHYWRSVVLVSLFFTLLATLYAYFKPDIYQSTATVDVGISEDRNSREEASRTETASLAKEIAIARSRFLLEQALQGLDFSHHYYVKFGLKERELYEASPFDVNLTKGFGSSFALLPLDETHYSVRAEGTDRASRKSWSHYGIYPYGSLVQNKHFSFAVKRNHRAPLEDKRYRFVVLDDKAAVSRAEQGVCIDELGKHTNILAIHVKDTVGLRAQRLADALAEAYIAQNVYKKSRETSKALSLSRRSSSRSRTTLDTPLSSWKISKKSPMLSIWRGNPSASWRD